MIALLRTTRRRSAGQSVIIFALSLIVIVGIMGLAIDVSSAYAASRSFRSAADAAALAGAQDLQGDTRAVTTDMQANARAHALASLVQEFGASATPACPVDSDGYINNCALPGTPYLVSIKTPAPTCKTGGCTVSALHAMQVTVRNPTYPVGFVTLFGINSFDIARTSVAGLGFSAKYAIQTLRPPYPLPSGLDQNRDDINLAGTNTRINVLSGDVGTNTSVVTNSSSMLTVAPGYQIFHYDNIVPDPWNKDGSGNPTGQLITSFLTDPQYRYADFTGAPVFSDAAAGATSCPAVDFPNDYPTVLPAATTICQRPGIYNNFKYTANSDTVYLLPGAYYFPNGATVHGTLAGGLISNKEGVVLVFPEGSASAFDANNAVNVLLNMGGSTCTSDACRASAALDFSSQPMVTPAGMILTIEVKPAPGQTCIDGAGVPHLCADNQNKTIGLAGNGQLGVAGIIYGPTDRMTINANQTVQTGVIGQILAWTVTYTGGATLNQEYPGGEGNGTLRLDAACTAPASPCVP